MTWKLPVCTILLPLFLVGCSGPETPAPDAGTTAVASVPDPASKSKQRKPAKVVRKVSVED